MIEFMQVNLGGGKGAQNLALQTTAEWNIDVLVLSKYYKFGRMHEQ